MSAPREIPSGGVLPILGNCYDAPCSVLRSAIVTDTASGARVEGVVEISEEEASFQSWAYFAPSVPFASGAMYRVTLPNYPALSAEVSVRDAAPAPLGAGALRATAELVKERLVKKRE